MITSLIGMLELPNFGHIYDVITFVSKFYYFKRLRVTNFADIIKIATMFIKTTLKNSNKFKKLEIMY